MKSTDTLYLIGPGSSIFDFDPKQLGDNPNTYLLRDIRLVL